MYTCPSISSREPALHPPVQVQLPAKGQPTSRLTPAPLGGNQICFTFYEVLKFPFFLSKKCPNKADWTIKCRNKQETMTYIQLKIIFGKLCRNCKYQLSYTDNKPWQQISKFSSSQVYSKAFKFLMFPHKYPGSKERIFL